MPFLPPSSVEEPMSLASLITGSNCLKTCGMEDMQYAARRASELFVTMRVCIIVLTSLLALCFVLRIALRFYNLNGRQKINFCSGGTHFIRDTKGKNFSQEQNEFGCSSSTSLSSSAQPTPIFSHSQLCQSAPELPCSHDTTAAATPLPIPPPSICRQRCTQNGEEEDDGSGANPNLFLTQCQFVNPTKQHFDSLSDYLLTKQITTPNIRNGN